MIGSLRGKLALKQPPTIIVECGGVGYELETPMSTFLDLPESGSEVFLFTYLHVREDAQTLFGFATEQEKSLFKSLLKVSGVGARIALAILSGMSVEEFSRCVRFEDKALLVKIPGIGNKTAARLIIDMRDRIDAGGAEVVPIRSGRGSANPRSEAMDALVALGYKPAEIRHLLGAVETDDKSAEDIIRMALRQAVS